MFTLTTGTYPHPYNKITKLKTSSLITQSSRVYIYNNTTRQNICAVTTEQHHEHSS